MNIAFRCDAGRLLGAGHLMRCLTLADALTAEGCNCDFLCREIPGNLAKRVKKQGHRLIPFSSEGDDGQSTEEADAAACLTALAGQNFDWLITDHYGLGTAWESVMRLVAKRILAIDDLVRSHDCDILFDQTLGRDPADYKTFVPTACTILCGARDALIRPEFAAVRAASLARRRAPHAIRRIFVNFGAGDCSDLLITALSALNEWPEIEVRAVLGASSLPKDLHVSYRLELFDFVDDVAAHFIWADFAIGAPGSSSWERACLGVPSIVIPFADNQKLVATNLNAAGLAWSISSDELITKLPGLMRPLLTENAILSRMSQSVSEMIDGWGACRLAARLLDRPLWLRAAVIEDCQILWQWANDSVIRQMSFNPDPILWEVHQSWFTKQLSHQGDNSYIWIGSDFAGHAIGQIRFNRLIPGNWSVDIHLAPEARGRGFGRLLLQAGLMRLKRATIVRQIRAEILPLNVSSLRIFQRSSFVLEDAGEKAHTYVLAGDLIP